MFATDTLGIAGYTQVDERCVSAGGVGGATERGTGKYLFDSVAVGAGIGDRGRAENVIWIFYADESK